MTMVLAIVVAVLVLMAKYLYLWRPNDSSGFYPVKPFYMAHRGVRTRAPENTISAYSAALEAGLKGTELDVMETKDGQLICSHNFDLERITDGRGYIFEQTYSELQQINAGHRFPGASTDRIPLLTDVLNFFPAEFRVNIEVKSRSLIDIFTTLKVARLVKIMDLQGRVIVSSFNPVALIAVKWVDNAILTGFLVGPDTWPLMRFINLAHPDCLHPEAGLVTEDLLRFARQRGLAVNVWTVNNQPAIDWLVKKDVEGIITDRPEYCPPHSELGIGRG